MNKQNISKGKGNARCLKRVVSLRRKCNCDRCTKWAPLHRRIMAKLRWKDRKLFFEYLMMVWNDSDELGAATAKLDGEWPGWEWMKEAIKEQQRKQANASNSATGDRGASSAKADGKA